MKINWSVIWGALGIAAQAVFVVWTASAQYSDLKREVAIVQLDVTYVRRDIDRLQRALEKDYAGINFSISE